MTAPAAYTDAELLAVRTDVGLWFDTYAFLEDRAKTLRRADPANNIQTQIFTAYQWCQEHGQPCNLIGLKSRKEGLSTGATALAYHHLANHTATGVVIGTDGDTGDTLMDMVLRYGAKDTFPWATALKHRPSENRAVWDHGSEIKRDTAVDPKAGRSSTVQVLVATEVAHWPSSGVRSADETMLSILNSMPDIPNIVRIVDSTANGAGGWFYDTYQGAVTIEERKRGVLGNGWIKVFEPWHASPLRRSPMTDAERAEMQPTFTERELAGKERYEWSDEQIKWRRETIATKCGGDEGRFDQEYPESEDVAFRSSGSPRFNVLQVARMRKAAERPWVGTMENKPGGPVLGHLRAVGQGVHFIASLEHPWLWLREEPIRGRRHLLFCDPMTGEQSAGAKFRDRHACGIIGDAYIDATGRYHLPEVVAAMYAPGLREEDGCRWEMDVLADRIALLSKWYGDCLIVSEVNKAMDLIPLLRERKATNLYRRPVRPDDNNPSERQDRVGFYTAAGNLGTRNLWVNAIAEGIREASFVCLYLPFIIDFENFILNAAGRAEAAPKKHDDGVAGVGIGLLTLPGATLMPMMVPTATRSVFDQEPVTAGGYSPYGACG